MNLVTIITDAAYNYEQLGDNDEGIHTNLDL